MPHVALWEAVALVLNIDPLGLQHSPQAWMHSGMGRPDPGPIFLERSFSSAEKAKGFSDALKFAERAANVAGPIHLRTALAIGMNKRKALVSLSEVVQFFVLCDWLDISPELLRLVSNSAHAETDPVVATAIVQLPKENAGPQALPKRSFRDMWPLKKPIRDDGLANPIYRVLKKAHDDGASRPTASDVLESFRLAKPGEVLKVMFDSCEYFDRQGRAVSADLESIRKRIGAMTGA